MTNEELNEQDTPRCEKCGGTVVGILWKVCANCTEKTRSDHSKNESIQYGGLLQDIFKKGAAYEVLH